MGESCQYHILFHAIDIIQSLYLGVPFDLTSSTRFPAGFDIYKEPYEGYTHRPHFLKQEEISQYAVKNSCPDITWNLYGFPMPQIKFKFEGKDIELGEKYTCTYSRNGIVKVYVIHKSTI